MNGRWPRVWAAVDKDTKTAHGPQGRHDARSSARRRTGAVLAAALLATTAGCGTLPERRDDVRAAAVRFEQALQAAQQTPLCDALAAGTREELEESAQRPCEQALDRQELPVAGAVRHVDVYGDQARAVLEHDTLFLARFPTGWKVTAAGCEPRSDQPYQCVVKGR
ncbi:hypothetical protein AB0F13_21100 [Streptomyces sp. NPDC026206]|uniref:hypothetical protein n=1 Tax=Streptomyces sp. NPDC026206 TaxID=3157089 RepID=UPI0033C72543